MAVLSVLEYCTLLWCWLWLLFPIAKIPDILILRTSKVAKMRTVALTQAQTERVGEGAHLWEVMLRFLQILQMPSVAVRYLSSAPTLIIRFESTLPYLEIAIFYLSALQFYLSTLQFLIKCKFVPPSWRVALFSWKYWGGKALSISHFLWKTSGGKFSSVLLSICLTYNDYNTQVFIDTLLTCT